MMITYTLSVQRDAILKQFQFQFFPTCAYALETRVFAAMFENRQDGGTVTWRVQEESLYNFPKPRSTGGPEGELECKVSLEIWGL